MRTVPNGGHVERDETPAEAAVREVREESGLEVRLLSGLRAPLPAGYPLRLMQQPWWVTETAVAADDHRAEPHVHVDYQYLAVADSVVPVCDPAHPFAWYSLAELADLSMFNDTRMLATMLLPDVVAAIETATGASRGDTA
ncbi:NUDIX domain-containing protein [Nocardia sp. CA-107356]|uniref:NUDIX domain-containing protein n=1 Tax=Nocardia sp. CA-107356 TaxID=3239972 RepID=UPI003D939B96